MINLTYRRPSLLMGALFILFLTLGLAGCHDDGAQYKTGEAPDIARWALPNADYVALLSDEPNECLSATPSPEQVMGRLAFRSPFLLGGQAARRGLTCQACHGQGDVNADFFVVGLSELPGTADVTSFHFSDVLGDESFNPVPIPSLSDDIETVDSSPDSPDLEVFVTRLITKEFTGPEPSPQVKAALLSYLRGLTAQPCETPRLKNAALLHYKLRIVTQSFTALTGPNISPEILNFMTAALRVELGRLHDRFPNNPKLQAELTALSRMLRGDDAPPAVTAAAKNWTGLKARLASAYDKSLFNPLIIRRWEAARRAVP